MADDSAPPPRGLTAAEVADRVARGQVNREVRNPWADYAEIVARNVFTLFNALVVPAAVALALLGEYRGAVAVTGMAVVNLAVALFQEVRAKRHLDRLALLAETRARVVRDGTVVELPSGEVVRDDVIRLSAGDAVVADGVVLEDRSLEIDEALLTGESDPVARRVGDKVTSGSVCAAGEGVYRVTAVGGEAFAQKTAAEGRRYRHDPGRLQRLLDRLLQILTAIAIGLCGLYVALYYVRGFSMTDLVQMIAATITSLVPQGLILMTTVALTLGAVRLTSRGALVQRLSAVEAMAEVEVLCMDKTGTLTTNRLALDRLVPLSGESEDSVRDRLRAFAWLSTDSRSKTILALRDALGPLTTPAEAVEVVPFKSQNRYSAVRARVGGEERYLVLGASEALAPRLAAGSEWEPAWRELLPTGLRLLLFAEADGPDAPLRPVALVALSDEVRPEAPAVLDELAAQGIRFVVLSGDNPETVRATVSGIGLDGAIATGDELANAADPAELLRTRKVFGRVAPHQKLDVVEALQKAGHPTAMLGDGLNDLLPIKRADLGVAMGDGSPATRTVADMVLEGNDFRLLPAALAQGRSVLATVRRAAKLFLVKNVYTLFLILVTVGVLAGPFPYLPQQVTLLNFLTIGMPALIVVGRGWSRPAGPERASFLAEVGWFALSTGLVVGVCGLAVWPFGDDEMSRRTLLLSTVISLGLLTLLRLDAAEAGDPLLKAWVPLGLVVYAAAMYWPLSADFFRLTPLGPAAWGLVAGVAAAGFGVCLLFDRRPTQFGRRDAPGGLGE